MAIASGGGGGRWLYPVGEGAVAVASGGGAVAVASRGGGSGCSQ